MTSSTPLLAARYFFGDLILDALAFPFWWYGKGFLRIMSWARRALVRRWEGLGLGVWIKNLFVPMYGATDLAGKLISFFLRLAIICLRGIAWAVWACCVACAVGLYLVALPLTIVGFVFHLLALLSLFG
ncbi:hypothetical protein HY734_02475 [Candidatus Uhrbacteria bacterium]|nr:hypothetical protein [Candidatus Uhrbacteria bacterium]